MHWSHPEYATDTNPRRWIQQSLNLAALPPPCAQPTLLFYIFGDCARHIAHISSPSSSAPAAQEALIAFFRPYFSRLPNYSAEDPAHQPAAALATSWTTDAFAGEGSYCNFQVGLERGDEDVEVMRRGEPERGVWLAGEHTAPFVALGTVTGAWWSGEGVARRVLGTYGVEVEGEIG